MNTAPCVPAYVARATCAGHQSHDRALSVDEPVLERCDATYQQQQVLFVPNQADKMNPATNGIPFWYSFTTATGNLKAKQVPFTMFKPHHPVWRGVRMYRMGRGGRW